MSCQETSLPIYIVSNKGLELHGLRKSSHLTLSIFELKAAQVAGHAGSQQVPILQRQGQLLPFVQHSLQSRGGKME